MRPLHTGAVGSWILSVILLALPGCAYYNTFYLAKKYYREGTKAQEKALTDSPSPEAASKYELTIRQCNKVLTEYSTSKYVDDATYFMGASYYGKGEYPSAIKRLAEFAVKFPKSPFVGDARLMEGLAHYRLKEYEVADTVLREVDVRFPKLDRKWQLYFYTGEVQAALERYPEATLYYGRALKASDKRRERADALRRAGDAFVEAGRPDTAETIYAECLRIEDRGPKRVEVALSRGDALLELKQYEAGLRFLEDWRVFAAAESREGELMLRVYALTALLGRVPAAIDGYRKLVEKFPRTNVAAEAQFRIGYLYESQLEDFDGAGREYDRLRGMPTSEFVTMGARRAQNLATLRQYRSAVASDTTSAAARSAFLLAELYYFQLGNIDSAMAQYRAVENGYPRSVYAPKSAYARLWITAQEWQDTLATMSLTDTIASRYRGTRYAESALYFWKRWSGRSDDRTVLFDSLLANPDTSRAGWFEPEPEPGVATTAPVDSAIDPRQGYQPSSEEQARIDSLRAVAQRMRDERIKAAGGAPPHHTPQPAVVDSAAVPAREPEPVPPPSPSGSASGSSGGGAPGDTTGGSTGTAPGDSTGGAPGDSTGGGTRATPIEDRRR
jgi:TolA-binding protein